MWNGERLLLAERSRIGDTTGLIDEEPTPEEKDEVAAISATVVPCRASASPGFQ